MGMPPIDFNTFFGNGQQTQPPLAPQPQAPAPAPQADPDKWWNSLGDADKIAVHGHLTQLAQQAINPQMASALSKAIAAQQALKTTGNFVNPSAVTAQGIPPAPASGPYIQWMGGMPPGYNDKVAQVNAALALAGNLRDVHRQQQARQQYQQSLQGLDPRALQWMLGMGMLGGGL